MIRALKKAPGSGRAPEHQHRILVVDDNERIHEDFRKILRPPRARPDSESLLALEGALFDQEIVPADPVSSSVHFELDFASQGHEGLELVERGLAEGHPFSLAFVDVRMPPGWDGIETTERLWQVDRALQVVLCTAYSDYSWSEIFARLGYTDRLLILKKPFDGAEVRQFALALTAKRTLLREHESLLKDLEAKVDSRTRDLEASNEQLRVEMQERLKVERRVRHLQKVQALGHLVASVGHEINNPLCFVTGNLELVATDLAELEAAGPKNPRWDDVREYIEAAAEGARRIASIVAAMRGFVGPREAADERAEVAPVLETVTVLVQNEIRHRARLRVHCDPVPALRIERRALEQVLVNLLLNAAHAITPGHAEDNEIRIRVARSADDRISVEVTDTGEGMEPEVVEHAFDPFYTTKPAGQGTGLGLSLSHELVTAAGGELSLRSQPGAGTTATVRLRVAPTARSISAGHPAAEAIEPESSARGRLLLVDDDPLILRFLERSLGRYETSVARNGQEALELCHRENFDLVLCDIMMPDLTGMEVYERVQRSDLGLADRFLFITGGAIGQEMERFLRTHKSRCIRKPFAPRQIREAVARHLTVPD